ncbi:MAG: BrnA antitoxin family protein [Candidatus Bathyarchaeota archaeon]|nr:BrnA antitoxin family protein [Candidatus Bathyarchaeum sp.]
MLTKKRKTVGRSFRIDEEWLNVLTEEAEKQGVSVNSLLNRLLQQYAYLRYMLRYGAITLTSKGFSNILECCADDKIKQKGKEAGESIVKDLLLTMGVPPSYSFVLCLVKKLLSEFAGWFECDHHIKRDKEILHLRHDLGKKWSIYLATITSGTFNSLLNQEVGIELSDSSVTITISKQNK